MYKINDLLNVMVEANASDLFITLGAYPMLKIDGKILPLEKEKVIPDTVRNLQAEMLNEKQQEAFLKNKELDFTYSLPGVGRFRVNYFRQRNSVAFVVRRIISKILTIEELGLPSMVSQLSMEERGLVIVVGGTGSGKSTTLASMVDYCNSHKTAHILTLEDPIEFLHSHKKGIVNQREVGQDSASYTAALRSALREAPTMLLIGEIRDKESMSAAMNFAETGHLVLTTLHANNAYQTIERIMSFYSVNEHEMTRLQLSQNLKAVIAQRLVPAIDGKRVAALEILLQTARVRDVIHRGDLDVLRHTIGSSKNEGMQLFDQHLFKLVMENIIDEDVAIRCADRPTDLSLKLRAEKPMTTTDDIHLEE
ncbi:MAG: PilT/PilU family type 4a pilus ATPase [Candidatus Marinimicrobia bacterium]|nr:PilT/PilU family type 4a pilus ATPase [Candidatus Neomarinimicrobiota bacterium]